MAEETFPRFGATGFYAIETDAGVLRERMRDALSAYLGYSPADTDPYMVTALALLPFVVQQAAVADSGAKSALMQYAVGGELDRIADAVCAVGYLNRSPSRPAIAFIRLNFTNSLPDSPDESSPSEYRYTYSGSVDFRGFTYSADSSGVIKRVESGGVYTYDTPAPFVYFFADLPGSAGNISASEASAISSAVKSALTVTFDGSPVAEGTDYVVTILGAAGGCDDEPDASFAKRLSTFKTGLHVPGSPEYYDSKIRPIYGLRDCYVSSVPYAAREGYEDEDAPYVGCVQVFYLPEAPSGSAYSAGGFDPKDGNDGTPLRERVIAALRDAKLAGDRIMLTPAKPYQPLQSYDLHYSVLRGTSASTIEAIQREYTKVLDEYCNRCGNMINFDDMAQRLINAGAFDAVVKYGSAVASNLQMYRNIYFPYGALSLTRDSDVEPVTGMSASTSPERAGAEVL